MSFEIVVDLLFFPFMVVGFSTGILNFVSLIQLMSCRNHLILTLKRHHPDLLEAMRSDHARPTSSPGFITEILNPDRFDLFLEDDVEVDSEVSFDRGRYIRIREFNRKVRMVFFATLGSLLILGMVISLLVISGLVQVPSEPSTWPTTTTR